jgi:hypothetical protein
MADYKLTSVNNVVLHIPTQTYVTKDTWLWDSYQQWLDAGNTPDPVITLDEAKKAQIQLVDAGCAASIISGFESNALGTVHTYPFKDTDQANLAASVMASDLPGTPQDWTTPFWCEDSEGNWGYVLHTAPQIQKVGMDGLSAKVSKIAHKIALEQAILQTDTIEGVQAITWTEPTTVQ